MSSPISIRTQSRPAQNWRERLLNPSPVGSLPSADHFLDKMTKSPGRVARPRFLDLLESRVTEIPAQLAPCSSPIGVCSTLTRVQDAAWLSGQRSRDQLSRAIQVNFRV
jgi:hypothetical protein